MILAYVDDAGNTGLNITDRNQPLHFVGAVLIHNEKWYALKQDLKSIQHDLPHSVGASAKFEFHGAELFNGTGIWQRLTESERLATYHACVDLLTARNITIVYGCCNKRRLQQYHSPMHPHEIGFWLCLEGVATHINSLAARAPNTCGQIVVDESNRDYRVARRFLDRYRKVGPPFGRAVNVSRIIDVVHSMNSLESPHLQLCDLCMYALRRHYVVNDDMAGVVPKVRRAVSDGRKFPY